MKALGVITLVMLGAAFCCVLVNEDTDAATFDVEGSVTYCKTSDSVSFTLSGDEAYYYVAEMISSNGSVNTTKTGTLSSSLLKSTVSVTAPSTAGSYYLKTTFYEDSTKETVIGEKKVPLKVVEAVTLTVTLSNSSLSDLSLDVYFIINGKKFDDSVKTVTVPAGTQSSTGEITAGTYDVTYDYVVENLGDTTYSLNTDSQLAASSLTGFGTEYHFYASDNDYTGMTVLVVIVLILIVIFIIHVYRKPVVNKGKPRGRR